MIDTKLYQGDCLEILKKLEPETANCCVTSPPYWGLRDYDIPPTEWPEVSFLPMLGLPEITIESQTCCFGLENDPWSYVGHAVIIFKEVFRILRDDGTLWLNLGDSYTGKPGPPGKSAQVGNTKTGVQSIGFNKTDIGLKNKDLIGIPWRVAFALQADGWYLRQDIIWHKPNPMPESVKDRCTKSHEYIFLLSKSAKYYFDHKAIKEHVGLKGSANSFRGGCYVNGNINNSELGKRTISGNTKIKKPSGWDTGAGGHGNFHRNGRGNPEYTEEYSSDGMRNKRSVWTVATKPYKEAHFATFPPELIKPCILAGCPPRGLVLDSFFGSGTVGEVAEKNNRDYIGIELNPEYIKLAEKRINKAHYQMGF